MSDPAPSRRVAVLTLGCSRNEVDSEEIAGKLDSDGWDLVTPEDSPDVVVVNTCGFIAAAKKDSIDTVLEAADTGARVVAVGCLAERYGAELAESLPEADAVLGFDAYPELGARLSDVLEGRRPPSHRPQDRRTMLPITPVERPAAAAEQPLPPGHGWALAAPRRRLDNAPTAPLKIASGCDRRCAFCAIPSFRGSFVSRRPQDILGEAAWLATQGVKELFLVSENSTSYGRDLGNPAALEQLLADLAQVPGVHRTRVSYLQPAEVRPGLVRAMVEIPEVATYFDLSFQHASPTVLRAMRRFGSTEAFLALLGQIRDLAPHAGVRSNVIVGFPGETDEDVVELERFLTRARLDAIGVFGYSDEEGTEAATLPGHVPDDVVAERLARISTLAEELTAQRAEERVGEVVDVLVETLAVAADDDEDWGDAVTVGRAGHQAPEVDGACVVTGPGTAELRIGDLVRCKVVGSAGVDLEVEPVEVLVPAGAG